VQARCRPFVTSIHRAEDTVVAAQWRGSGLAVVYSVAGLDAVTEDAVSAERVGWSMGDYVVYFVASVDRAAHSIIYGRGISRLAVEGYVASLGTVTECQVVTERVGWSMGDYVVYFVASVDRAAHSIIYGRGSSRLAVEGCVASLRAVTEGKIVAERVGWCVDDDVV